MVFVTKSTTFNIKAMAENYNTTYEVCPHCGEEVELKAELSVQTCPKCGKRIVTCSMCRACNTRYGGNYCNSCCLEYQAETENEELSKTITIWRAEEKVRLMAENEQIEDRVYELIQSLVEGYISEVNAGNTIVDCDCNPCTGEDADGSMWYDEVREEVKKTLFEKLSEFFQK